MAESGLFFIHSLTPGSECTLSTRSLKKGYFSVKSMPNIPGIEEVKPTTKNSAHES